MLWATQFILVSTQILCLINLTVSLKVYLSDFDSRRHALKKDNYILFRPFDEWKLSPFPFQLLSSAHFRWLWPFHVCVFHREIEFTQIAKQSFDAILFFIPNRNFKCLSEMLTFGTQSLRSKPRKQGALFDFPHQTCFHK